MLAISALIHLPLVYAGVYYLFPDFRVIDFFSQIMLTTAVSIALTFVESGLEWSPGRNNYSEKEFQLLPLIWVSMVTFIFCLVCFLFGDCPSWLIYSFYLANLLITYFSVSRKEEKELRKNKTKFDHTDP